MFSNPTSAKNLKPRENGKAGDKFQVLDSTHKPFPTIYTCTRIETKGDLNNVHCTFEGKQGKQKFTGHTLFPGETKVVKV